MRLSIHGIIALSALSLAYGGFLFVCPELSKDLGIDLWNCSEHEVALREATEKAGALAQTSDRVKRRIELKCLITQELIAGRLDLAGATEQFMSLNQLEPEITTNTRLLFPSSSDEESTAIQVVYYVRATAAKGEASGIAAVKRVEADLAAMQKARGSTVKLQ